MSVDSLFYYTVIIIMTFMSAMMITALIQDVTDPSFNENISKANKSIGEIYEKH